VIEANVGGPERANYFRLEAKCPQTDGFRNPFYLGRKNDPAPLGPELAVRVGPEELPPLSDEASNVRGRICPFRDLSMQKLENARIANIHAASRKGAFSGDLLET
jgi:hypothetical protein